MRDVDGLSKSNSEGDTAAGTSLAVRVVELYPGVVVSAMLALAASALASHYSTPVMLFALLLGMAVNFLAADARCAPGLSFCSKTVLRVGVALLGLRITASFLGEIGWNAAFVVVAAVVLTILAGMLFARIMKLDSGFGLLTGGSVAICGASAAIAIAAVLPEKGKGEQKLAFVIIGVTAMSTLAMILYPIAAGQIGLDETAAGVFLGGTIHDVAQVVGAGYAVSERAGDLATVVKMLRVSMLVPVVLVIMLAFRTSGNNSRPTFPLFLVIFVVLATVGSFGLFPDVVISAGSTLSRACLIVAIAAVGAKTVLRDIIQLGWRPTLLLVIETLFIAGAVLAGYRYIPM